MLSLPDSKPYASVVLLDLSYIKSRVLCWRHQIINNYFLGHAVLYAYYNFLTCHTNRNTQLLRCMKEVQWINNGTFCWQTETRVSTGSVTTVERRRRPVRTVRWWRVRWRCGFLNGTSWRPADIPTREPTAPTTRPSESFFQKNSGGWVGGSVVGTV